MVVWGSGVQVVSSYIPFGGPGGLTATSLWGAGDLKGFRVWGFGVLDFRVLSYMQLPSSCCTCCCILSFLWGWVVVIFVSCRMLMCVPACLPASTALLCCARAYQSNRAATNVRMYVLKSLLYSIVTVGQELGQ